MRGDILVKPEVITILKKIEQSFAQIEPIEQLRVDVTTALAEGVAPVEILQSMRSGLVEVGRKYEQGEFFLSELIMSGIMAQEISSILKPHLLKSNSQSLGKVIICTVKGDVHDLGKNLVSMMLNSAGFEVKDLGVDVHPDTLVETIAIEKPAVVAMSCLLTTAMSEMKTSMNLLEQKGIRANLKVLVGGRPITLDFARDIDADGYGQDAIEAMKIAKRVLQQT